MGADVQKYHRRSIRLAGYDYSQAGDYFVTICVHDRMCLFGEIINGEMRLNDAGKIVKQCWDEIPAHFPHVVLDEYVVMPNHVHGIIILVNSDVGATHASPLHDASPQRNNVSSARPRGPQRHSIASIVGSFKSATTKRINEHRGTPRLPVWQRNYYEHIIRNDESLNRIREYIITNPLRWHTDNQNPSGKRQERK
jgi:REP element-mobilizing transposase RayT